MERLRQRVSTAKRALATLQELLELDTLSVVEEMRPFSVLNIPLKRFGKPAKHS